MRKIDDVFDDLAKQNVEIPRSADVEELIKLEASYLLVALRSRKSVATKRSLYALPSGLFLHASSLIFNSDR